MRLMDFGRVVGRYILRRTGRCKANRSNKHAVFVLHGSYPQGDSGWTPGDGNNHQLCFKLIVVLSVLRVLYLLKEWMQERFEVAPQIKVRIIGNHPC